MQPIWFNNFDGVVNALMTPHGKKPFLKNYGSWNEKIIKGYHVNYSPDVIDFINEMSEKVTVKWITDWKQDVVDLVSPEIGLKSFEVVEADGTISPLGLAKKPNLEPVEEAGMFNQGAERRWWKINVVLDHIKNGGEDFLWTDDDIHETARLYVQRMAKFEGIDSLILRPKASHGLEPSHLEMIQNFISRVSK